MVFSSKYGAGHCVTPPPHIICFSNILPINPSYLNLDRWKLFRIGNTSNSNASMSMSQANYLMKDHAPFNREVSKNSQKGLDIQLPESPY